MRWLRVSKAIWITDLQQNIRSLSVLTTTVFFLQINRPFPSYFLPPLKKRVFVQNLSCEKEYDLHEYELVVEKHFHMSGFARRRFLKTRQEATRKWPITQGCCSKMNLMFKYDGPVNNCKRVSIFTSLFFYNWPSSLFSSNEAVKVSSLSFISFISPRMFFFISLFICWNLSLMFSEDKYWALLTPN